KYAIPLIDGQVLAQGNVGGGAGALVRGIRGEDLGRISIVSSNIKQGTVDGFDTGEGVAIGKRMAENLGLVLGDTITLISPEGDVTPLGTTPRMKGHDIANLRTMGASRGAILRIFLMTGAAIGVTGTIAGVLLGVVICLNIESIRQFFSWMTGRILFNPELYFLSQLPAKMDPRETTYVVIMALGLSFIATVFPAWRAARLDPVEALRYE